MKLSYEPGDKCWIALWGETGLHAGTVQAGFKTQAFPTYYYIIKLDNPEWPIFETRDALMIAETEDGPLAYELIGREGDNTGMQ